MRPERRRRKTGRLLFKALAVALSSLLVGFLAALAVPRSAPPVTRPAPSAVASGGIQHPRKTEPAAWLRPTRAAPGSLVVVTLVSVQGEIREADLSAFDRVFALSRREGTFVGLLPVPADAPSAVAPVTIHWRGSDGVTGEVGLRLDITEAGFAESHITLSAEKLALRGNSDKIAADRKRVARARSRLTSRPLRAAKFELPVQGRRTTPFGFTRYVNGEFRGRHSGLDLAAPTGTPVVASASGVVILAEPLHMTGNTVILDHGAALSTSYCHLNSLAVVPGEHVTGGRIIGTVGDTGVVTGPHLHWGAASGGVHFDPAALLNLPGGDWNNPPPVR